MKKGRVRENIVCVDGFKFSVQASEGHYCEPRINQNLVTDFHTDYTGIKEYDEKVINVHYTSLECGLTSAEEDLLTPYHELADENGKIPDDIDNCYGNVDIYMGVPARVVMDVIVKHGGIVSGSLPPLSFNKEEE